MARKNAFNSLQGNTGSTKSGRGAAFNATTGPYKETSGKKKPTETIKATGMPAPFSNPLIKPMNMTAAPVRKVTT